MPTVNSAQLTEIQNSLRAVEAEHNVRILYACESGSRAWGFESPDSDYDVRFIYMRPSDWYLSVNLEAKRDVIELPIDEVLDINGWDVRKALQLFAKSNPPLNEWLVSSIVYMKRDHFIDRLRELAPLAYNPISAHYHYLHMASTNFRAFLKGELVRRKKYLYVLRPLLAIRWIEAGLGVVPIEFERLFRQTVSAGNLRDEIEELVRIKRSTRETSDGPRMLAIHEFIEGELARHKASPTCEAGERIDMETLNQLFRQTLQDW